ncbi:MAG: thiosulfate oxidation carrier complex protein SoxZ [Gammaproteobacteria bacterium]|jgi:sulfur-oxidizing protein SoxZ|nr:thiosulfate oxidation carrier complex protein SoxZ [Gammaproteobacteria bacterium]HUV20842.1 thiosulfate oxidation carrier complex protein SoxZ [Gammaproteobacteria bacterium]
MASIKIRAKAQDGVTTVKTLISHKMESGQRKDSKTGEKIPAHHITEVMAEHNGKQVMSANWGGAISQNPYLSFKFKGAAAGDTVKISWVDNMGKGDSAEAQIK